MIKRTGLLPAEIIESKIFLIRSQKVMMDRDLAALYGVTTFNLNKAIKRNSRRFPDDFMFKLTFKEYQSLRFQTGILKRGQHSKYLPNVFTEQGVAMLSSVLHSTRAIRVNIQIMRTFTKLRKMLETHKDLRIQIEALERKYAKHDHQIQQVFHAIKLLLAEKRDHKPKAIGFIRG